MNAHRPESSGSEARGKPSVEKSESRTRLPRSSRITRSNEIRALFQKGKRSRTAHLDVFDSASPFSHPRVGIVVPKHKRSSVERNLLKRRLRELMRTIVVPQLRTAGANLDVLVRARREAYAATFSQLREEVVAWMEKWSPAR